MRGEKESIDFLCLGGASEGNLQRMDSIKREALGMYKEQLKKEGFTKIVFVDHEGKENILHENKQDDKNEKYE